MPARPLPAESPAELCWTEAGQARSAWWRSERGSSPPRRVVRADDSTTADSAYRLACEGTALMWRGDFNNARLLLQALARRAKRPAAVRQKKPQAPGPGAETFHLHRQAEAQRARVLSMLLIEFGPDYRIDLRRAPDVAVACREAWGPADKLAGNSVTSLRELLGVIGAHEWRRKGLEIATLGGPPLNRIHPHYGVFSPVRGEYLALLTEALQARLSIGAVPLAFDIGTGSGVLAALLARGGVSRVQATDTEPRALACAADNLTRLGLIDRVELMAVDLFPPGRAPLVVCNPPWLPARAVTPIERAVYDEASGMLLGFLNGLAAHLSEGGEGWLILSDLAEHLGLRTRDWLLQAFSNAGLQVAGKLDTAPAHARSADPDDPLHQARSAEVTSLWRLVAKATGTDRGTGP